MKDTRLKQQVSFLNELERLKIVYRQNSVIDRSRAENSAEHSWNVALMALIFKEYCVDQSVDIEKTVKMLLLHDVVEVYSGDNWIYNEDNDIQERERKAASKIFGLLPEDQKKQMASIWQEFDRGESTEAKFARAIDSIQPLMNHLLTGSRTTEHRIVKKEQIMAKKRHIEDISPRLWEYAVETIEKSVQDGLYQE